MTHITTLGAGLFSDLSISVPAVGGHATDLALLNTQGEFMDGSYFTTVKDTATMGTAITDYIRVPGVREFPSMGTPPNIVNVPGFGSKTSQQIQGQSDAPSLELTLNYIAADWDDANPLPVYMKNGILTIFRFTLLNNEPPVSYDGDAAGLGAVENTSWFWLGKLEALQVNPQLTDANTATLTMSLQSQFFGAYTQAP